MSAPNQYNKIPDFATKIDAKSFSIDWHGEIFKYTKDDKLNKWVKVTTEDASADATSSASIATVEVPLFMPKKKKKKIVKEMATPGSVNTVDFTNDPSDFGTDSPRLPSELGDLTGFKSLGMGSGFLDFNLQITDPFTGEKYELLRVLNSHGTDHPGSSTVTDPVLHSPYDEYIPDGQFTFKSPSSKSDAIKTEINTRIAHVRLKDILQQVFIDSINNKDNSKSISHVATNVKKSINDVNELNAKDKNIKGK